MDVFCLSVLWLNKFAQWKVRGRIQIRCVTEAFHQATVSVLIINYSVLTFLTFWSPQIDDLETLEAAREDDLHRAGLKVGDIIKVRRVLQARSKESPLNSSLSSLSETGSVDITPDSKKSPTQSVSVLSITIYIFPPKRHVSFLCCCEAPSLILEYNFIDRE